MGWFNNDQEDAYNQYQQYRQEPEKHKAKFSHELIAAAASYEAAKAYEDHVAENGRPDSHAKAKEIFAGFAGAFLDKEVETHGLDMIDKARHHAKSHGEQYTSDGY